MDQQPYTGPNLPKITGAPPSDDWSSFPEASKGDSWDAFPEANAVTALGLGKAGLTGIAKGAIGLAGAPGDLAELAKKGADYVADKLPDVPAPADDSALGKVAKFLRDESAKTANLPAAQTGSGDQPGSYVPPTSAQLQGSVEDITGPFHKPANQAEADVQTAGEFVPAALAGPGGLVRKAITQVAIPAAATVTAGRFSDQNPYVKALAGFVAGGAAALSGPGSTAQVLRSKLPASVTEQDITRAGQLIEHGQQRGVALTWPEALTRVTGQPVLTDMQRILESHGQTRPAMQEFFADRPAQVENAARRQTDTLGTLPASPSTIGPQASEVANDTLNGVRQQINHASQPFYDASEGILLTPAEMSHVRAIPGFEEASQAVRDNPQINWRVAHLPDNSVGFLNEVKKHFDQAAENSASKFNPGRNKQVQSSNEMAAGALRDINLVKSEEHALAHGTTDNYQAALEIQRQGRERFLTPLLQGPLGKLAKKDVTTQKAIAALFPENPVPGTEGEIRNAVSALARQRPAVAEALVRAHVEMTFNQAARDLQGGANHFAGAKFAVKLVGGAQQRANLQAAIEALPNGTARWEGFEHLLDIMAATGARQPKGSLTAFNALEVQSMSGGGLQSLAAKAASPGKWWTLANDSFNSWRLGHNLDQLARIITSPDSGEALRQIVRIPAGSDRALMMAGRIIGALGASTTDQRTKPN